MPKDANGNILFAVIYQQLENKDIEIKTFKKKFDVESASIIADLDNPVDISTDAEWSIFWTYGLWTSARNASGDRKWPWTVIFKNFSIDGLITLFELMPVL